MKTLLLMRHAEASDGGEGMEDRDRPLTAAGRRAARAMGRELRSIGLDAMIASPARRAAQTLGEVGEGYGSRLRSTIDRRAYPGSPEVVLDIVHAQGGEADRLLLIGHNPGIAALAAQLAGERLAGGFSPGCVAVIAFDADQWDEVAAGSGRLARLIRPGDLPGG